LLDYYSAVIDLPGNRLYLLDPIRRVPKLQGVWDSEAIERRGKPIPAEKHPAIRLAFTGGSVREVVAFPTGSPVATQTTDYRLVLEPRVETNCFDLHTADGHVTMCHYKLEGDRLTVAMPFAATDDRSERKLLTDPPGSYHIVVHFRRVPPPAGKK
jgi:uncharacterized protein (TIGR03067 family)